MNKYNNFCCNWIFYTICTAVIVLRGNISTAEPVLWNVNGHCYDFISAPEISWTAAKEDAESLFFMNTQGHLATITSASENTFIFDTFGSAFDEAWLGGYQTPGSAPTENWHWVTGELWEYTNWAVGEPGDSGGDETYLSMWSGTFPGVWNDDENDTHPWNTDGYLIEYPIPEPAGICLLGLGGWAMICNRRREK